MQTNDVRSMELLEIELFDYLIEFKQIVIYPRPKIQPRYSHA